MPLTKHGGAFMVMYENKKFENNRSIFSANYQSRASPSNTALVVPRPNSTILSDEKVCRKSCALNDPLILEELAIMIVRTWADSSKGHQMLVQLLSKSGEEMSLQKSHQPSAISSRDIKNKEIVRPRDLPQCTGLSRTTIHRLRKAGNFVPHIKLSTGAIGFSRDAIEIWLKSREEI